MIRPRLPATAITVTVALLAPLLACSGQEEEPVRPEGVYPLAVTGRVYSHGLEGVEDFPDTLELEWPDSIDFELIEYEEVERNMCSDAGCWYGNASVTVDGGLPDTATVEPEGVGAVVIKVITDGLGIQPTEPSSCSLFSAGVASLHVRLEDGVAEGAAEVDMRCVVSIEGEVQHFYEGVFRAALNGSRLAGEDGDSR
jgi:hypothetical protein